MSKIKLAICLFAFSSIGERKMPAADLQRQTASISIDTSILLALSKFGSEMSVPIGIVLETNSPHRLCEENRQITIRDRPVSDFIDKLLAHSNYAWSVNDGVIVIRPAHVTDQIDRVLSIKFDEFGGIPTTMQGLGIFLSSRLSGRLHPEAKGYAGNIISSPDAEHFPELELRDASVEQILNKIVSLGSKGMWLFQLDKDFEHSRNVDLHTYSYKDDANALQGICSASSN